MADDEPPSTPCRWRAMTILMRLKNKIREKLWVSQMLNDIPDLHMETETASTSNEQQYYDASSQAFQASPSGDLLSQLLYLEESADTSTTTPAHEPEAFITLTELGIENQVELPIYGMAEPDFYLDADCDMQDVNDQISAEMIDAGDLGGPLRQSSSSAEEWQRNILSLQQFLGVERGLGLNVVVGIVSVFKRISGLIRRRRQERVAAAAAVDGQTRRRIRSAVVTRYKGIRHRNGKWVSEHRIGGTSEKVWLGSYNTEKEAALAFDAAKHHCSLRRFRGGFNFADSPRLLGAPQRFTHLSSVERRARIQRLAEEHARAYASADIR